MPDSSPYSSKSWIIHERPSLDGNSAVHKVRFSKTSSQKPRSNRAVSSSSKGVLRTKNSWCPPGRRPSESAHVTDDTPSSKDALGKNVDGDSGRYRSGQMSTGLRSFPAAGSRRGSRTWSGRRGTNATVLNGGIGSRQRQSACANDLDSAIRVDSNEPSLELDQRQSVDNFAGQGREENLDLNDDATTRDSIDEIRRRVRSLQEHEVRGFSREGSEDVEGEYLAAARGEKSTLGPSEVLTGHSGQVLSLVQHDGIIFSAAADGTAKAWDTQTQRCLATYKGHRKPVWGLQLTGRTLVTGGADGTVRFWDIEATELLHIMDLRRPVRDIAVAGDILAVATSSADIDVIDLNATTWKSTLKGHLMAVASLTSLDGGTRVASGSHDTFIRVWNPETGSCEAVLGGHSGTVGALSVTSALPLYNGRGVTAQGTGSSIISGSGDATVRVWGRSIKEEGEGWACLAVLENHRHGVWAVHGSPFSSIFVTGGGDATIQLWAPANIISLEGGSDEVDATGRRFDEGGRPKWECISGVRGTIGAVGAVLICEEGLFFGTSEALITRFPFESSLPAGDEGAV